MKKKLAAFVVDCRLVIFVVMLIVAVVSVLLMQKVEINEDLTQYLPDDSAMKQGMDIMTEVFPEAETSQTIRVMFDDLSETDKENVLEALQNIEYVDSVTYEADNTAYNIDNHTLYIINSSYEYSSEEMASIENSLDRNFSAYTMVWNDDDTGFSDIPTWIILLAVGILMTILFVMCGSWIEPILFLVGIGFAVVINRGTNICLGSVSNITASISSMLQLVLSMDYSIILINRYKQEKQKYSNNQDAMKAAVAHAFTSVVSSAMTTVCGLLVLVFMRFKIGMDLGVVLAKGVFLSMFCVLILMPGIFLFCDKLIQKTRKKEPHIPMDWAGRFSYKFRHVISGVFIVLMVAAYLLEQQTDIVYTLEKEDKVAEVFPTDNTVVMVYETKDEDAVTQIAQALNEDENVKSVKSYGTLFAKAYTVAELSDVIAQMSDTIQIDKNVLAMFYYDYYVGDEKLDTTDSDISEEMSTLLAGMGIEINDNTRQLLALYNAAINHSDPEWTMTIEQLFNYVVDTVLTDERFSGLLDEETKSSLTEAKTSLEEGIKQLATEQYSRMILTTSYAAESEETFSFIENLESQCEEQLTGNTYLIGSSVMNYEMSQTFDDELLLITLLTVAVIFVIVAISSKSFLIPFILVLLVQTGVYTTIASIGLQGNDIYYLALLIVQCILMGATIDYGILYTNYYIEYRSQLGLQEALKKAYAGAMHTIATSGLILVLVTAIVGKGFTEPTVSAIVETISTGAFTAIVLILLVLPGILACCDKLVVRNRMK